MPTVAIELMRLTMIVGEAMEKGLEHLKVRSEKNMNRHKRLKWANVQDKLAAHPEKLWSVSEMERTGGEPDVVGHDKKTGQYIFYDSSSESPKGRRSLCYDQQLGVKNDKTEKQH